MDERSTYQAYLIRGWQEEGAGWRFRLQDVGTKEQIGFTSLKALMIYLGEVFEDEDGESAGEEAQ